MLSTLLVLVVAMLVGRKAMEIIDNKNRSRGWVAAAVAAVLGGALIFATGASLAGLSYPWTLVPALAGGGALGLLVVHHLRGLSRLRSRWDIAAEGP